MGRGLRDLGGFLCVVGLFSFGEGIVCRFTARYGYLEPINAAIRNYGNTVVPICV